MKAADLLYLARSRAGMTQAELGQAAGLAQHAISRVERGQVDPGFGTVVRLVRACGFELEISLARRDQSYARDVRRRLSLSPLDRLEQAVHLAHTAQETRRTALADKAEE
ncbi:MAG: helix-turn-helix transcriptional regulator [Mycobacteriales bacterium]